MIRKMLVIAAAVAMPASAIAAVTTVSASGVAGAAAKVYASQTCAVTGTVTFAAPGLSNTGSLGKKANVTSTSAVTATGTGCGPGVSGSVGVKSKISTAATDCRIPAVPPAVLPGACALYNTSKATAKTPFAYSNASNLATAGVSSIVASLSAKGLKLDDNGNKVTGAVTVGGTSSVLPGGACGSTVGFSLAGATNITGLSYALTLCLVGDTGTNTTGAFFTDYLAAAGGDTTITIASALVSSSSLVFTYAP